MGTETPAHGSPGEHSLVVTALVGICSAQSPRFPVPGWKDASRIYGALLEHRLDVTRSLRNR